MLIAVLAVPELALAAKRRTPNVAVLLADDLDWKLCMAVAGGNGKGPARRNIETMKKWAAEGK